MITSFGPSKNWPINTYVYLNFQRFCLKRSKGEQLVNHEKTIAVAEHRIKQSTSEIDDKMGKYDEVITNVQRLSSGNFE